MSRAQASQDGIQTVLFAYSNETTPPYIRLKNIVNTAFSEPFLRHNSALQQEDMDGSNAYQT